MTASYRWKAESMIKYRANMSLEAIRRTSHSVSKVILFAFSFIEFLEACGATIGVPPSNGRGSKNHIWYSSWTGSSPFGRNKIDVSSSVYTTWARNRAQRDTLGFPPYDLERIELWIAVWPKSWINSFLVWYSRFFGAPHIMWMRFSTTSRVTYCNRGITGSI